MTASIGPSPSPGVCYKKKIPMLIKLTIQVLPYGPDHITPTIERTFQLIHNYLT